jgi:hypothetical protein
VFVEKKLDSAEKKLNDQVDVMREESTIMEGFRYRINSVYPVVQGG